MDLKEEGILGNGINTHWYYVSKGRALQAILGDLKFDNILDVGAGSGIFSKQLLDNGFCDEATCVDPNYHEEKIELHNGKKIHFVKGIDIPTQKLILMMDVLEHVPDDRTFLEKYTSNMQEGGYVLITVPAFPSMWSSHDVFLEHYRRYTLRGLEACVSKVGLKTVKSCYYFGSLFPIIALLRFINKCLFANSLVKAKSDLKLYPAWLNRLLVAIHDFERKTIFPRNKFCGLSLFCLCRKEKLF